MSRCTTLQPGVYVTFDGDEVSGYGLHGAKVGKKAVVQVAGGHWVSWAAQSRSP